MVSKRVYARLKKVLGLGLGEGGGRGGEGLGLGLAGLRSVVFGEGVGGEEEESDTRVHVRKGLDKQVVSNLIEHSRDEVTRFNTAEVY